MVSYTDNNYGCKWKPRTVVAAKRDFPEWFYDITNESSSVKKHKVCKGDNNSYVGPDEGMFDFIPLKTERDSDTKSVSVESCCFGTNGLGYDIIPQIVKAATSGLEEGIGESGGGYEEVRSHGVSLKEIRCDESEDGLKIELSVANLKKKCADDESFGNESRACESVADRVKNERVKMYKRIFSRRRLVWAVRSDPTRCGPVKKMNLKEIC